MSGKAKQSISSSIKEDGYRKLGMVHGRAILQGVTIRDSLENNIAWDLGIPNCHARIAGELFHIYIAFEND